MNRALKTTSFRSPWGFNNNSRGCSAAEPVVRRRPNNPNPATMLQVLATDITKPDDRQFVLGRVVVASLLNTRMLGVEYPVTEHTIIAMFNATFGGGSYPVVVGSVTVSWSRERVIEYLSSLFEAFLIP